MKVTFIQPYYHNIWEPLGLGYIGAYIKQEYHESLNINFYQAFFDSDDKIIKGSFNSDIVAFSTTSPSFQHAINLSVKIKKLNPNVRTIFGGWHVTALKQLGLKPTIDQIVIGEGELGILSAINGNKDKIIYGGIVPFKDLPWPDRVLIKNERTIALSEKMSGKRTASFQAHRVCPLNCVFCSESTMTGKFNRKSNPIRERDINDLLKEILHYKIYYNLNYFKFVDATFDTSAKYVIEFCKKKIETSIASLKWECLIHASFATEEMFYWLHKAKCDQINVGCESGSDKILKDIGKGLNVKIITRVFDWAKKYNIKRRGFFILGMPNETQEDIELTKKLINRIEPDVVGFTILCPYPGCQLYNHDKMKDIDWSKTDEYSNDFWQTDHFTNAQLKKTQKHLTNKYLSLLCDRQNKS